jgi:hypothetical protein
MLSYEELVKVNSELLGRVGELQRLVERQQRRIDELEKLIEDLRRRGKRQAAPFSKGAPKDDPKPPGRKPGAGYGKQVVRAVPQTIDERLSVDCPLWCPDCHGRVRLAGKKSQYQIDLPEIRPRTTEFIIHYGQCESCGKRVQGRHARQISDALDVGRVQLGPAVISLTALLNKVGGMSYGKIEAVHRAARRRLQHLPTAPQQVRHARLMIRVLETAIRRPAVGADHASVLLGQDQGRLGVAAAARNRIDRFLRRREHPQPRTMSCDPPAGFVRIGHRCRTHPVDQVPVRRLQ